MTLRLGDCLEVMRGMADNSVDSIVTDPPYGIRFMGKSWDGADIEARISERRSFASKDPTVGPNGAHSSIAAEAGKYDLSPKGMLAFQQFSEDWAREAIRVLKPGGHLLSFASTRTYHRMVCGIEQAGFEIRDQIGWAFGSGFPKSHNGEWGGTALKPAWEPICMARKPLIGTVEANWREHGTGGLNIDGCRVEAEERPPVTGRGGIPARNHEHESRAPGIVAQPHDLGRWPANLVHDGSDEVLAAFPQSAGQLADAKTDGSNKFGNVYSPMKYGNGRADEPSADSDNDGAVGFKMKPGARRGDLGSAARFFYCAKASRADRNEGCESMPKKPLLWSSGEQSPGTFQSDRSAHNSHPTVKPTDLMRWLVRLVTPKGGTVLDPFMGSGSTGRAAALEGFEFIGIELSPAYMEIARARIDSARRQGHQPSLLGSAA